jgi:steroid delta-isomerase-like uncharacterized protein
MRERQAMSTKDLRSWTSERVQAWNEHDPDTYAAYYAEDAVVYDPMYPEPLSGRDAIREDFEGYLTAFPDAKYTLGSVVASDDSVAFELTARGTHTGPIPTATGVIPATNRSIEMPVAAFARVNDQGLVAEERRYFDLAGLLQQLGVAA